MIETKLKELKQAKDAKASIQSDLGKLNETIERLSDEITEEFQSRQIKSMKLEGIGNFVLAVKSYPRAKDKIVLREWMESKGYGWDMLLAYNAKKFQGFYNELLDNKKELPPEIEAFMKTEIRVTV